MVNVTNLSNLLNNCAGLTTVDLSPLSGMVNVTNLSNLLNNCAGLTTMVGLPYFGKATGYSYFMRDCTSYTSCLPELWIQYYGKSVSKTNCFSNCQKAANWLEVPKSWGGTALEYTPPAVSGVVLADYRALDTRLKNVEEKLNLN